MAGHKDGVAGRIAAASVPCEESVYEGNVLTSDRQTQVGDRVIPFGMGLAEAVLACICEGNGFVL